MKAINITLLLFSINMCLLVGYSVASDVSPPPLTLAKSYQNKIDLDDYWVSEKYDGYRAYWDGKQLISRQGNVFRAPHWFTEGFPPVPLDGELWIGRQKFQTLASIVRRQKPHQGWNEVRFMVFDLPLSAETFEQRLSKLNHLVSRSSSRFLISVPQFKVSNHEDLIEQLDQIVEEGAEGLMLHRGQSLYQSGRSGDLLKLKPLQDAEARVVQHIPGKGKHLGRLGSLVVELPSGLSFRIGTGFSDKQRDNPPEIGSWVTYQYTGTTDRGIPRFARFLRIREDYIPR